MLGVSSAARASNMTLDEARRLGPRRVVDDSGSAKCAQMIGECRVAPHFGRKGKHDRRRIKANVLVCEQHAIELHHGHAVLDRQVELQHQQVEAPALQRGECFVAVSRFDHRDSFRLDQRTQHVADRAQAVRNQHAPARSGWKR